MWHLGCFEFVLLSLSTFLLKHCGQMKCFFLFLNIWIIMLKNTFGSRCGSSNMIFLQWFMTSRWPFVDSNSMERINRFSIAWVTSLENILWSILPQRLILDVSAKQGKVFSTNDSSSSFKFVSSAICEFVSPTSLSTDGCWFLSDRSCRGCSVVLFWMSLETLFCPWRGSTLYPVSMAAALWSSWTITMNTQTAQTWYNFN